MEAFSFRKRASVDDSFRDFLDKLRLSIDIVDVVGRRVELKRAGANYKGLCPFHAEKTPSFVVSPDRQTFHCFGCNVGGNAIEFVKRSENLDFMDAVELLAQQAGLAIPRRGSREENDEARKRREALMAVNALAAEFFASALAHPTQGREARRYLAERGVAGDTIQRFGIGLAPDGWDNLLRAGKARGYTEETMAEAGLLSHNPEKGRYFDRFRSRVIFPICDPRGRPIAFGGRVFGLEAQNPEAVKYINSPETPIYKKGRNLYAFHLARDEIREKRQAILLEGYMDVVALHRHGFQNAVASLGTALTPEQAKLLKRVCDEAVFLYDDDEAGQKAMLRGVEILLEQELSVKCVGLAPGEDPDSYLRDHGRAAFEERLTEARPFFDYFLHRLRGQVDFSTVAGKTEAADRLRPLIRATRNVIEAEDYLQRLAQALQLAPDVMRAHLRLGGGARIRSAPAHPPPAPVRIETAAAKRAHQAEVALLRILIDQPESAATMADFDLDWIESPQVRIWIERIAASGGKRGGLTEWLDETDNEAERGFLRGVAMAELTVADPDATLRNALARLRARWQKRRARALTESLRSSASASGSGAPAWRGPCEEIHRLHRERHAAMKHGRALADEAGHS